MVRIQSSLIAKRNLLYKTLSNKLLQGKFRPVSERESKKEALKKRNLENITSKYSKQESRENYLVDYIFFKGLNLSVKGRLKGVRRARTVKVHFGGTRPNTFSQPQHFRQLPIKTK